MTSVDGVSLTYDAWNAVIGDQHGNAITYTADGEVRSVTGLGAAPVELRRDSEALPVAHLEGGLVARLDHWDLNPARLPLEVRESSGVSRSYIKSADGFVGILDGGLYVGAELDPQGSWLRHDASVFNAATRYGEGATAPAGTDERFLVGGMEAIAGAVNLHLPRHRTYDATTGQFQSSDPIGLNGGPHRFRYADNDPVQFVDPMGWQAQGSGTPGTPPTSTSQRPSCLPPPQVNATIELPGIPDDGGLPDLTPPYVESPTRGPASPFGRGVKVVAKVMGKGLGKIYPHAETPEEGGDSEAPSDPTPNPDDPGQPEDPSEDPEPNPDDQTPGPEEPNPPKPNPDDPKPGPDDPAPIDPDDPKPDGDEDPWWDIVVIGEGIQEWQGPILTRSQEPPPPEEEEPDGLIFYVGPGGDFALPVLPVFAGTLSGGFYVDTRGKFGLYGASGAKATIQAGGSVNADFGVNNAKTFGKRVMQLSDLLDFSEAASWGVGGGTAPVGVDGDVVLGLSADPNKAPVQGLHFSVGIPGLTLEASPPGPIVAGSLTYRFQLYP